MVERYLAPLLDVRLDKLDTADIDSFYSALRERGGLNGRPLKGSSVRRIHAIVHRCLEQGVIWSWVARNPADRISPVVQDNEVTPPTPDRCWLCSTPQNVTTSTSQRS
jgi:integrase